VLFQSEQSKAFAYLNQSLKNKRRKSKWPGSDYKLLSPSEYYNKTI
jgi:hypothetical protein